MSDLQLTIAETSSTKRLKYFLLEVLSRYPSTFMPRANEARVERLKQQLSAKKPQN